MVHSLVLLSHIVFVKGLHTEVSRSVVLSDVAMRLRHGLLRLVQGRARHRNRINVNVRPLLINVAIALHLHEKCFLLCLDLTTMLHINKAVRASVRFLLFFAVATILFGPE